MWEGIYNKGGGVMDWKGGCKKLVGFGSDSIKSSGVSIVGLFKWELVRNTVWVESSKSMCGELDEKLGLKTGGGGKGEICDQSKIVLSVKVGGIGKWTIEGPNLFAHSGPKNN